MYIEASNIIAIARAEASSIREATSIEANTLADIKTQEVKKELEARYNKFASELETDCQSLKVSLVEKMPLFKSALSAKLSSI
jgi:F-type H+-transporting ATPase subunit b